MEGKFISGIAPEKFHVYENGVEQKIDRVITEAAPFHVPLLMDISRSASIARPDMEHAALDFLRTLRPGDGGMVLSVNYWIYVDSEFTDNVDRLQKAILNSGKRAGIPYTGTNFKRIIDDPARDVTTRLYDAIDLTITERLSTISGRKAMLVFTDGVDVGSRLANRSTLLARVEESDVVVYVVCYDTPLPTNTLKPKDKVPLEGSGAAYREAADYLHHLVASGGGRFIKVTSAADVRAAFSAIA